MKQQLICMAVALGVLAGCGDSGGSSDPKCQTGACGAQRFCAHTPDGGVCWKDTTAPVISTSSLTCSTSPCRRDSVLTVTATVADESYGNAMGEVKVALDLDKEHPLTLQRVSPTGNDYRLEVKLEDLPFPYFAHDVAGTVLASDEATNGATQELAAVGVTRERWTLALTGQGGTAYRLYSPAVTADGRIIVAGSDGSIHFVTKEGARERAAVVIGGEVDSPPALGSDAIWLATPGGQLHKRAIIDGAPASLTSCSTPQPLVGPPAVSGASAFVGSKQAAVLAAGASGGCTKASTVSAVTSPVTLSGIGKIYLAAGSVLRSFSYDSQIELLVESWSGIPPSPPPPSLSDVVATAISVDGEGALWTVAQSGVVSRTTPAATSTNLEPSVAAGSGGIVLADGSFVLANSDKLARVRIGGSAPWTVSDSFEGSPATALALGGASSTILVVTDQGRLYVVGEADGHVQWSKELSAQPLQPPNIWTEPGAKTSTAYLASANGTLYAVIVDGTLDTTAPWPKAYHDPQNTSNAATPF